MTVLNDKNAPTSTLQLVTNGISKQQREHYNMYILVVIDFYRLNFMKKNYLLYIFSITLLKPSNAYIYH